MRSEADGEGERDRELIAGVRRGDAAAYRALVDRYAPLLATYGRRLGLHADEAAEIAADVLADVAVDLARARRPAAGGIAARAGALFRERVHAEKHDRQRHLDCARDARAYVERERPVGALPGTCSEDAARLARGADWEPPAASGALARLGAHLDARLTPEEHDMLAWVAEHLPQRVMADWLGVGHAAARKRLGRLRQRLAREAEAFIEGLPEDERREVARALGRRAAAGAAAGPGAARERAAPGADGTVGATDE